MAKYKSLEEAVAALTKQKEVYNGTSTELKEFKSKHKLHFGKKSDDPKVNKKLEELQAKNNKEKGLVEEIEKAVKELKPKTRETGKYDYPEGLSADEKKKFRAAKRKEGKEASKPEAKEKKEKAAPAKDEKKDKKAAKTDEAAETVKKPLKKGLLGKKKDD